MVFQHIEKLKQEYTDKYVVVDETRPELARFKNQTGIVRTVNMSGRALVEFDAHANIGWFDIDVDFLKIIDKPLEPETKPAAKPAAAKPKAAAPAGGKAPGGKMSVQEMLAAARSEKESAEKPAEPAKPAAKMSVADMLAAARAEKSGEAPAAEAPEAPSAPPEAPPAAPAAAAEEAPAAKKTDIPTDIPGILAYCRKVDG